MSCDELSEACPCLATPLWTSRVSVLDLGSRLKRQASLNLAGELLNELAAAEVRPGGWL